MAGPCPSGIYFSWDKAPTQASTSIMIHVDLRSLDILLILSQHHVCSPTLGLPAKWRDPICDWGIFDHDLSPAFPNSWHVPKGLPFQLNHTRIYTHKSPRSFYQRGPERYTHRTACHKSIGQTLLLVHFAFLGRRQWLNEPRQTSSTENRKAAPIRLKVVRTPWKNPKGVSRIAAQWPTTALFLAYEHAASATNALP